MPDMSYREWCRECRKYTPGGLSLEDLPDGPSRECYEDGITPEEYIKEILIDFDDMLKGYFDEV